MTLLTATHAFCDDSGNATRFKHIQRLRLSAEEWRDAVVAATQQLGYSAERAIEANLAAALRSRDLAALGALVAELNVLRAAGRALDVDVDGEGETCVEALRTCIAITAWAFDFCTAARAGRAPTPPPPPPRAAVPLRAEESEPEFDDSDSASGDDHPAAVADAPGAPIVVVAAQRNAAASMAELLRRAKHIGISAADVASDCAMGVRAALVEASRDIALTASVRTVSCCLSVAVALF